MRWLLALGVLLALTGGCGGDGTASEGELLVGAASSLEPLFSELGPAFEEETGAKVIFVYGSSGSLAAQIEQGAPLDVFASANRGFVVRLQEQGLVLNDRQRVFAEGRLVAITSMSAGELGPDATWRSAVTDEGVRYIALANQELAPYGAAAQRALERAGLWERLQPKLVYAANVAQVLQFVQSGNADVGFIAAAQVAAVPPQGFLSLPIDACEHGPLPQVIVGIRSSKTAARPGLAERFWAFVGSPATQDTLGRHGYAPAARASEDRGCE